MLSSPDGDTANAKEYETEVTLMRKIPGKPQKISRN
jgi:hypothetical protein